MKIGSVDLPSPFAIAPMAGMTDTAFRRLVKRHGGCGLVVTEMVSSEGLVRGIDRTLGLIFGLARGAALAIAVYIFACMAIPPEHWPPPVLESRSLPYIYSGAAWVAKMMPPEYQPQVPPPPLPSSGSSPGRQAAMDGILKVSPVGRATDPPIRR